MEYWKRAVLAGSAGIAAVMFVKGNKAAGLILAGIGLATLASEYPEKFEELQESLPDYIERGTNYLDMITKAGRRLADAAENGNAEWLKLGRSYIR